MKYPDTDRFADEAITLWRAGRTSGEVTLAYPRPWRAVPDVATLQVQYHCSGEPGAPRLSARSNGIEVSLDDPVRLESVDIPKPWGREIWFSGIEARGESRVAGRGGSMPLSSYLALAPERTCRRQPLVLLKILDPLPEPVRGELYLEVHQHKREVYVVTAVDRNSWPDGKGQIRYGINQAKRRAFEDDTAFRQAFLTALHEYERIRRAVDEGQPGMETAERAAREATLEFTDCRELTVGDAISVPTWVPHSLQQGVRVVEFQTPTYERYILSSTQRVTTQSRWDSDIAVARMSLEPPVVAAPEKVQPGIERIVRFEDFGVWRLQRDSAQTISLPDATPYALAVCIKGRLSLGGPSAALTLEPGQAAFIPASATGQPVSADPETLALLAAPGL